MALPFAHAAANGDEWRAPFITTPADVVERMLQMAETRADDLVIDLGSGDGRIVIAAAQQFGARGLGIELDARAGREVAQECRAGASFFPGELRAGRRADRRHFPRTVITVYLLPALMEKLQSRFINQLAPGTRIVSHAFTMAGWAPDRSETVRITQRHPGQGNESRVHLWIVPANVRGVWRGPEMQVRIEQNYQASTSRARAARPFPAATSPGKSAARASAHGWTAIA